MTKNALTVPVAAVTTVVADVARYGSRNVETGGFLLAPGEDDTTTMVALAGEVGIARRRDLFQVSEHALDRLFGYADDHGFWIPAQFHSHGFAAFMSDCDVDHGLSVEGFVTTIVPYFASPPADVGQWGWWCFEGVWVPLPPPRTLSAVVSVIVFDEDGVRGC